MMHHVVTSNPQPFAPLTKLTLPHQPKPQKLDWATECQTPLNANEDKAAPGSSSDPSAKDNAVSTSPGSEDGPDQPDTPPTITAIRRAPQKTSFSPSPLVLGSNETLNRLSWRIGDDARSTLAEDLFKMQIRDPKTDDPVQARTVHSRASSGDTSSSDASSAVQQQQQQQAQLQINTAVGSALASKPYTAAPGARPRELVLSDADRKRLQLPPVKMAGMEPTQGPKTSPPRDPQSRDQGPRFQAETPGGQQPRYPTLQDQPQYPSIQYQQQQQNQQNLQAQQQHGHRPPPIQVARQDDEYLPRMPAPGPAQFVPQVRPDPAQFRPRQYPLPQPLLPPSAGYAYAAPHLPLGPPTPQMYDLTLPGSPFRGAHQHSASDPASAGLRDAQAQLALMAGLHHPFGANALPPQMMYPGQFFQGMPQTAQFPQTPNTAGTFPGGGGSGTPGSAGSQNGGPPGGPSANNRKLGLYKTELCRSWEEKGSCRYGPKCQFAHGEDEIRKVARHPKYKTEICRTFWVSGSCPYGKRCCFIHTELPAPGASPAGASGSPPADGAPATNGPAGAGANRARSASTTSDPTDAPVSLLTRIAAQRSADAQATANANANANSLATPTEGSATPTYPQQRPGALRVDTSTLDAQLSMKQNKSAYPYTNTHSLPKGSDHAQLISPGPVTAGPDLGRSSARFDVVGYNERYSKQAQTPTTGQQTPTNTQSSNALRHSFNGTETLNLQTQLALSSGHSSPFGAEGNNNAGGAGSKATAAPTSAHSRSDSSSSANWGGGFTRGLGVPTNAGSPWTGDLSVGANRLGNNNSNNNWS